MLALSVHGALLGAVLAGLAGLVETACVLAGHPYHRDAGLFLEVLPAYLAAGAVLGWICAWLLPVLTRRRDREAFPGLLLGCAVVSAGAILVGLFLLHDRLLPRSVPSLSARGLLASLLVAVAGAALFLLLSRFARGRFGWLVAGFFSPFAALSGLACLGFCGWIGWLMPPAAAPLALRGPAPAAGAPNILLVVMDTVSAGHLGCYGHFRNASGEIDRLAREGVLFENAFAAAPWTLPSHASIFTGLHPTTHGAGWEHPRLEDGRALLGGRPLADFHTLAEELGLRGWESCGISQKSWVSFGTGLTQGFQRYWDFSQPLPRERLFLPALAERLRARFGTPRPETDKGAARIIDQALDWVGGGRGRDSRRPFFLFLNLNEAHDPFRPPPDFERRFLPDTVPIESYRQLRQDPPYRKEFICGGRGFEEHEPEILKAMYDAEIAYQDAQLGRLLAGLREANLMEDTLVVVTADHGEEFGEHGVLGHQLLLTDGMLRVPLILRHPATLPAGRRVAGLASLVDLFPTLLEFVDRALGASPAPSPELQALEGVSLFPSWEIGASVRDFVVAHYSNCATHLRSYPCWDPEDPEAGPLWKHARGLSCLRTQDRKLLSGEDGRLRIVDLLADPGEFAAGAPAAGDAPAQELVRLLPAYLTRLRQRRLLLLDPMERWRGSRPAVAAPRGEVTRLEETGYAGAPQDAAEEPADRLPVPPRRQP